MNYSLNANIKKLRQQAGLSQIELADKLNVSKQCVSNWENDNVLPSILMLVQIADFFGVSTDYLLGRNESRTLSTIGLTEEQISHINILIKDMVSLNKQISQ